MLDSFLVRFRGVSDSLPWCFGVAEAPGKGWQNWQKTIFNIGKRLLFLIFNRVSEGTLDSFLLRFRGVSVLHCHGVLVWRRVVYVVFSTGDSTTGKGWQNWQKAISNRVSEGTLNIFLVRFRGVSVLHCHGVLVWRRAVFSSGFSTTGKRLAKLAKGYYGFDGRLKKRKRLGKRHFSRCLLLGLQAGDVI